MLPRQSAAHTTPVKQSNLTEEESQDPVEVFTRAASDGDIDLMQSVLEKVDQKNKEVLFDIL